MPCEGQCGEIASGNFRGFVELDGTLFFAMKRIMRETELWKSDGTSEGTQLVTTISGDAYISDAMGSQLVLRDQRDQMWSSDGTEEGTYLEGSDDVKVPGERRFYHTGQELWVTDGTDEGTYLVKEITLAGNRDSCGITKMLSTGDTVYFLAEDVDGNSALWKSDGTEDGTVIPETDVSWKGANDALNALRQRILEDLDAAAAKAPSFPAITIRQEYAQQDSNDARRLKETEFCQRAAMKLHATERYSTLFNEPGRRVTGRTAG